jgi:hypothetical protein
VQGQKQHRSEAEEWLFRLAKNPKQYEKETFIDGINEINRIIEEFKKMYETTPATDDSLRAEKITLYKIQAKYEIFKKYKMRTAISK